jgi:hypothetical protein
MSHNIFLATAFHLKIFHLSPSTMSLLMLTIVETLAAMRREIRPLLETAQWRAC